MMVDSFQFILSDSLQFLVLLNLIDMNDLKLIDTLAIACLSYRLLLLKVFWQPLAGR